MAWLMKVIEAGSSKVSPPAMVDKIATNFIRSVLKKVQEAGACLDSFQNPYKGPSGESLCTDVAIIGPEHATEFIVLGSGTHGVEGFAGSGIQTGLLRD